MKQAAETSGNQQAGKVISAIQYVSRSTGTVVAPGNAISLGAVEAARHGIPQIDTWRGIGLCCVSFMLDTLDGPAARYTGTASKLGEAVDATSDKVKLGYALVKTWQLDLAPKELLATVAVQNGINTGLTLADRAMNKEEPAIHPSWAGKRAIFLQQWGIGLNVVGARMEKDRMRYAKGVKTTGNIVGAAGVVLGGVATYGYAQTLIESRTDDQ